mgnify:CR=1 FL=1
MKIWNEVWDYIKMFIIVIVVVLVVNNVVLINAKIPSESMEQTIMTGDRIFGFRMAYGINFDFFGTHVSKKMKDPERYDIIIFKYPDDEGQLFIKRLIGLPGDTVEIKNGKVFINGEEDEEANSHVRKHRPAIMVRTLCRRDAISCLVITASIPRIPDSGAIRS